MTAQLEQRMGPQEMRELRKRAAEASWAPKREQKTLGRNAFGANSGDGSTGDG